MTLTPARAFPVLFLLVGLAVTTAMLVTVPSGASASWTGFRGGPSRNSSAPDELPDRLGIEWTLPANGDVRTPLCVNGTAYVASSAGRVYAVEVASGNLSWSVDIGDFIYLPMEIIGDEVQVFFEDRGYVVPLAGGNATAFHLSGNVYSTPVPLGAYQLLGTEDELVLHDGGVVIWNQSLSDVPSTIASNGDRAYVRDQGTLIGFDDDRSNVTAALPEAQGSPVLHGGRIYIISGTSLRTYDLDLSLDTAIPVAEGAKNLAVGELLVFTVERNITAYDPETLVHKWTGGVNADITTPPLVMSDKVAIGTEEGISLLSSKGKLLQEIGLDDRVLGGLAPCDGGILAATRGNTLYYLSSDVDGDLVADAVDAFPSDPTQWSDADGDGHGDNATGNDADAFPTDPTQWSDADGDGHGDNPNGTSPDALPWNPTQWLDSDGDGYGDDPDGTEADRFPSDPTQWNDTDGDGYGDNPAGTSPDAFPSDRTQWNDTDGDGYGDNPSGNSPDRFPSDPTQWRDVDNDGHGDNPNGTDPDLFPLNPTQWSDSDGDGFGDDPHGLDGDRFPSDPTQWNDTDGDGYGDNPSGNFPDMFPSDPTQWNDTDGDGYGDNPAGTSPDAFPSDRTQWNDTDGDGYGDNPDGTDPDAFPTDPDEWADSDGDGVGDNSDPRPYDGDNDGVDDADDAFPTDPAASVDTDMDGHPDAWNPGKGPMDSTTGLTIDRFPKVSSQWADSDGDGHGDNPVGYMGDLFPDDKDEWADSDGDGHGDNGDVFPDDPDEWADSDGDGIGDNADQYPYDRDNDGRPDDRDEFPDDPDEWADSDGDGIGDNADRIPVHDGHLFTGLAVFVIVFLFVVIAFTYARYTARRRAAAARARKAEGRRSTPAARRAATRPGPTGGPPGRGGTRRKVVKRAAAPPGPARARPAAGPRKRPVAGPKPRKPAFGPSAAGIRDEDLEEVHRRYRAHLARLLETMREKGVPSATVARYSSRARQGPMRRRVDALMKGAAEAERAIRAFDTSMALSNELKMAAAELRDRGYATASLRVDAIEADRLIREGDDRSALKLIVPVLPHVRRLRALPRGSERPADEVELLVRSRRVLASGDAAASRLLMADALAQRGAEVRGEVLVVPEAEPWGISFDCAGRAVRTEDVEAAAVHLALQALKRVHIFTGIGAVPQALRKADEMKVVQVMGTNEAMDLIWTDTSGARHVPEAVGSGGATAESPSGPGVRTAEAPAAPAARAVPDVTGAPAAPKGDGAPTTAVPKTRAGGPAGARKPGPPAARPAGRSARPKGSARERPAIARKGSPPPRRKR